MKIGFALSLFLNSILLCGFYVKREPTAMGIASIIYSFFAGVIIVSLIIIENSQF